MCFFMTGGHVPFIYNGCDAYATKRYVSADFTPNWILTPTSKWKTNF